MECLALLQITIMKRGTYFWSCHIPKDKLRELGATDILPAKHDWLQGFVPEPDKEGLEWVYKADPTFESFVKFACDRDIVQVSHRHHRAIARGKAPGIGNSSKLGGKISCVKWQLIKVADGS